MKNKKQLRKPVSIDGKLPCPYCRCVDIGREDESDERSDATEVLFRCESCDQVFRVYTDVMVVAMEKLSRQEQKLVVRGDAA